jgi:hypothetical protein
MGGFWALKVFSGAEKKTCLLQLQFIALIPASEILVECKV